MLKYEIVILITFLLFGCRLNSDNQKKKEIEKVVETWHGKQIIFPDSIFILEKEILYPVEVNPLNSGKLKLLTLVSGDCMSCIENLNKWSHFLDSLRSFSDIKLVVIIITSDLDRFIKDFYPLINDDFTLYIDVAFNFLITYQMPEDLTLRTFLLDKTNKVLLIGNPIYRNEIKRLYINKIIEYEKKNI
ncbi:MAG: hypothetical protein EPN88_06975 [Bacteroidetes bacterium]|nr:MAG: hypothetical protein EPN88_06975 [Bacteroidota bacterium]